MAFLLGMQHNSQKTLMILKVCDVSMYFRFFLSSLKKMIAEITFTCVRNSQLSYISRLTITYILGIFFLLSLVAKFKLLHILFHIQPYVHRNMYLLLLLINFSPSVGSGTRLSCKLHFACVPANYPWWLSDCFQHGNCRPKHILPESYVAIHLFSLKDL